MKNPITILQTLREAGINTMSRGEVFLTVAFNNGLSAVDLKNRLGTGKGETWAKATFLYDIGLVEMEKSELGNVYRTSYRLTAAGELLARKILS